MIEWCSYWQIVSTNGSNQLRAYDIAQGRPVFALAATESNIECVSNLPSQPKATPATV